LLPERPRQHEDARQVQVEEGKGGRMRPRGHRDPVPGQQDLAAREDRRHGARGKIAGISDLRDESDRDGLRIVIELKKDANPKVVLNQLFVHSPLQTTFGAIMLAIVDGRPQVMSLRR
jgi:hypothetical protein